MKKFLVYFVVLLCLSGCAKVNPNNLDKEIDEVVTNFDKYEVPRVNNTSAYFSYYLPSDMQETEYDTNNSVFVYDNARMIVNLNIASVIQEKYYIASIDNEGFFNEDNLFYSSNGVYHNNYGNVKSYDLFIYNLDEDYIVYLVNSDVIFYGYSDIYDLKEVLRHMFIISKSIDVDRDSVINDYSYKGVINYQKEPVNLYNIIVPSEGSLDELIEISNIDNNK